MWAPISALALFLNEVDMFGFISEFTSLLKLRIADMRRQ
jgi:hypothetical protein